MDDFITVLLGNTAYSIFGFMCGWLVGHEAKVLREIRGAVVPNVDAPSEATPSHRTRPPWYQSIGMLVLLLATFTVIQGAYFTYQQRQATECLSEYNRDFAEVQQLRTDWAQEDRDALVSFFKTFESATDSEVRRQAFLNLISTYQRNGVKRAENPPPELEPCG